MFFCGCWCFFCSWMTLVKKNKEMLPVLYFPYINTRSMYHLDAFSSCFCHFFSTFNISIFKINIIATHIMATLHTIPDWLFVFCWMLFNWQNCLQNWCRRGNVINCARTEIVCEGLLEWVSEKKQALVCYNGILSTASQPNGLYN